MSNDRKEKLPEIESRQVMGSSPGAKPITKKRVSHVSWNQPASSYTLRSRAVTCPKTAH
jgi:hypothetical protein